MHAGHLTLTCLAALGLAACTQQSAAPVVSRNPIFATDLAGKAAACNAAAVNLAQGQDATGTIATGGGGWCGIPVTLDGNSLGYGLLVQRPRNGRVYVHTVGDATRVDYTPAGPVTADAFTVKFMPGGETMRVTVSGATAAVAK